MTIKGYPDQTAAAAGQNRYATVNRVREGQLGLDVIAHAFTQLIGSDAAEAASTTRVITATAHAALVGDIISWTSGTLNTREYRVEAVDTNSITTSVAMAAAPTATDTFSILRQKAGVVSAAGGITTSISNDTNYGAVGANTLRTGAQVGNATGAADFGSGAAGAQTLRTVLATRHEAAATPVSARLGDGSSFVGFDFGLSSAGMRVAAVLGNASGALAYDTGASSAATPRVVLATRHEAVATPLAVQLSTGSAAIAYDTGASGVTVPRIVLATRHEAAATPVSVRLSNGSAFGAPETAATGANQKNGKISGTALTGSYATVLATTFACKWLGLFNSCDNTILVSLDGGTTQAFELEAGESASVDLGCNGLNIATSVNISAKHAGAAPTAGTIRATVIG